MPTHNQRKSRLQERRAAKSLGGRVQVASGATPFAKGDVRVAGSIRAECKTTGAKSYTLKLHEWQKIQGEAMSGGFEMPVMQIEFQGPVGLNRKLAIISWEDFEEMLKERHSSDACTYHSRPDPHCTACQAVGQ